MVSALWKASSEGDLEMVHQLLNEASAVDVELKDHTGVTPLIEAVRNGHIEIVRALLDKGADPTNASSQGRAEQYTSDPVILQLLNYAQNAAPSNVVPAHEQAYVHDTDKSYYGPPPGSYPYYPNINPALSPNGEGAMYYPPSAPGMVDNQALNAPGNLPPPEIARFIPCRYFPACRYGATCLFAHPQAPYYQPSMPSPTPYPSYDPMGAPPYAQSYYPVSPPSFPSPNGVHMTSMSPPPPAPHLMHARSPSEIVSPPPTHFSPNGVPPPLPYGPISPSSYSHPGQMPVPMSIPPLPPLHHQPTLAPTGPQSPNGYNSPNSSIPPFTVQQDLSSRYQQQPPNVNYQENDGGIKPPPTNVQPDTYGANPVHRDGLGHHRRGAGRRGSFGGRKPPCLFFPSGRCKNGDECRFPHVLTDGPSPHHPPFFAGRGGHGGPRPRPHINGNINAPQANGFSPIEEKLNTLTISDEPPRQQNGVDDSSRSHSTDAGARPRYGNGNRNHHYGGGHSGHGAHPHPKKQAAAVKQQQQRVPNADEFPVLAGSITPPSRSPGLNGVLPNGNGHSGPTAAQVLQAPPPARKDSVRESSTRGVSPDPAPSAPKVESNGAVVDVPTHAHVQEQSINKLPISFAAMATAAPDVSKEVSVSA
ncbi:hypothetical protein BDQ12DRAFT_686069 [Crucibulum laeve]|uniref:C3H1-type domain-containing protein n=1 Tax=Crucibulum laeve TaxID=68775 RepID=A0A5C3LXQ5_9AGAR|nr:hypothetical protein BDQ12DRAFT_686069 [Crucibulum laeve]